ncbi:hypothetical protein BLNAU_16777 [Blattamonas nauphoetae]|uniref:Protein kinase domain-containing protein n=1 Tax=Blattamonas nauphoetae TaxID=2049346 RepID=A0ABQ9X874_9EUKA|nr:hypothetical protein BLNAU_16777 [Blattamonas nauphoetae]
MPMLVSKRDTLYNRLHKNTDLPKIDKRTVQMNVVKGIQALASAAHFDALLKMMSPHSIQLVKDDEVVFRIDNPMTAGASQNKTHTGPSNAPADNLGGNEGERWQAPETRLDHHESNTATPNKSTPTQAAVFSLGLILQEIETGMVPFGELDAQNAQRQLGTGLIPPMIGMKTRSSLR